MAGFADIAVASAQAESFNYDDVRGLIVSGDLDANTKHILWDLMDHARSLEAKLAAASRPAPAPVKRAPRGSSVGARNAARGSLTTDENVAEPDASNPFN